MKWSRHRRRLGVLESADMHRCVKTGVGCLEKSVVSIARLVSGGSIVEARRQPSTVVVGSGSRYIKMLLWLNEGSEEDWVESL